MRIKLNGEPAEVRATRLADLLDELGYGDAKIATAVNEDFVPVGERGAVALAEGDRLEILTPRQGG